LGWVCPKRLFGKKRWKVSRAPRNFKPGVPSKTRKNGETGYWNLLSKGPLKEPNNGWILMVKKQNGIGLTFPTLLRKMP